MSKLAYRRILLKLSGEALMGDEDYGIDPAVMAIFFERMLAEEGAVQPAGDPGEHEGSGVSLPIAIASHPDHGERIRFFREWQAPGP